MIGNSHANGASNQSVTGVPDPCGHQPGERHRLFQVIW